MPKPKRIIIAGRRKPYGMQNLPSQGPRRNVDRRDLDARIAKARMVTQMVAGLLSATMKAKEAKHGRA